jgi:hypothetical protein
MHAVFQSDVCNGWLVGWFEHMEHGLQVQCMD